ncbi:MAG: hypothetical protein AAB131_11420 [Actinomycetota bacterium]
MQDQIFADPRLAAIYDDFNRDRFDLDHYEAIVDELGAHDRCGCRWWRGRRRRVST